MDARSPVTQDAHAIRPDASATLAVLRRLFSFYCVLAALVTFGYALYDDFQLDGDAVAYMDIGDYLRAHHWGAVVNGYWHPMYPALLSLGHALFHSTLQNELHAYYMVNFGIFLLGMVSVVWFADAIVELREQRSESREQQFVLERYGLRYVGLALLVIASQRELSIGKIRPDALLQALLLMAIAALLRYFATGRLRYAAWMGLALGCAYLTKSFAFVFALISIAVLVLVRWLWMKTPVARAIAATVVAFVCFGVLAGPYMAALSKQHGRLDFGDSGALNYAWYVAGTHKKHLEPYMTAEFGSSEVHLKHPETELLRSPQVLSYARHPLGTYPDWFDTTYWNDQVKPHFNLHGELSRGSRNCVLVVRYLFNHPESLILLGLVLALGGRFVAGWRESVFWMVPAGLGVVIWGIYATVNTEERYVTVAFFSIMLALFAALRVRGSAAPQEEPEAKASFSADSVPRAGARSYSGLASDERLRNVAAGMAVLLALLAVGESLRTVLEDRRQLSLRGVPGGWYSPNQEHAADALKSMGLQPGDSVACVGFVACLDDPYWARLARVRIMDEIYDPDALPAYEFLDALPNREQAIDVVKGQGAKVLVAGFGGAPLDEQGLVAEGWKELGDSTLYELPLNVPPGTVPKKQPPPVRRKPSI